MNELTLALTVVGGIATLLLPGPLAALPLLLCAAYVTRDAAVDIGPATLTAVRLLVPIGLVRVVLERTRLAHGLNSLDRILIAWGLFLLGSSAFHPSDAWVYRTGLLWTQLGCYFFLRCVLRGRADVLRVFRALSLLLVPLAVLMLWEKFIGHNLFSAVGGFSEVDIRDDQFRARGPFAHAILAGTVGAGCVATSLCVWARHRLHAVLGLLAAVAIVFASTSSGPIMMVVFILLGSLLWFVRHMMSPIRWLALLGIIMLDAIMKAPVYFLMARIDIAGGSTGWHRAQLIRSALEHLDEWWLVGTDYTRHWMSSGVPANSIQADITNHFLAMGVMGGLPLLLLFLGTLVAAFRSVGLALRHSQARSVEHRLFIWILGALLFGHVMNFFSISLFDNSVVYYYLVLAAISAVQPDQRSAQRASPGGLRGRPRLQGATTAVPVPRMPTARALNGAP